MVWLTAATCLIVGVVIGVVCSSRLNSSASRVQELENQISDLKDNHASYKDNVSDHFNMTADLVQHMTESYREVYQHLASGAQDLCSDEVASKLLPAGSDAVFESNENPESSNGELNPPKDYVAKQDLGLEDTLSEEFEINQPISYNEETSNTPKH